jgi:hypothetical protein
VLFEGHMVTEAGCDVEQHAVGTASDLGAYAISRKEDNVGFQFRLPLALVTRLGWMIRNELAGAASEATHRSERCWLRIAG